MNFSQRLAAFTPDRDSVLTVGVFDGVHLGHRHLLDHLIDWAGESCVSTVLTFSNRPVTVFRPGTFPSYLTTPEHKVGLLKEAGVELVVPLEFTEELSRVSARQFAELLSGTMRMKAWFSVPIRPWAKEGRGISPTCRPRVSGWASG